MRGVAGAGPDDAEPPAAVDVLATLVAVPLAVEDADVDDVVIDVVGVVAGAAEVDDVRFEPPHPATTAAASATAQNCAESLTFAA